MIEKVKKIGSIVVLIILLPIFFINSVILIDSFIHPDEIPSFFGWKPFIVLSGSMETEILGGDLAVVKEVDLNTIKENDIIAFRDGDIVTTHRVIDIVEEDGVRKYKTKGDSNNMEDDGYALPEEIEGKYQFKISKLGNLAMFTQTPVGMLICLSIPIGMLLLLQMSDSKRKYKNDAINKQNEMQKEIERLKKQNEELMKK